MWTLVIHNSFKTGAKKGSDCELQEHLKAMWKFLQKAPTRRSLCENVSESLDYPLQFCGYRWCENEKSFKRAEMILEDYRKFINHTCSLKKSQEPDGKNERFQYLKSMIHESLLLTRLKFFGMVSGKLNVILRSFQTKLPFIADTLGDLACGFFGRITLKDVLKKKSNLYNLIWINLFDKNIRKNPESVDIGFAAKPKLEQVSPIWILQRFWNSRNKLDTFSPATPSPLRYTVVRSAVCLNPMYMRNPAKENSCESQMDIRPRSLYHLVKFLLDLLN